MKLEKHLNDISEIRSMMERSSKFLSLSGISGIVVGLIGMLAAAFAQWFAARRGVDLFARDSKLDALDMWSVIIFGIAVLLLAVGAAAYFTTRLARSQGLKVWSPSAWQLITSLAIPVGAGGLFSISLLYQGELYLVAPVLLIFYGLGLINASRFTVIEIRYLGIAEIVLGLLASVRPEFGLYFWVAGFGILHALNGIFMYLKYEK